MQCASGCISIAGSRRSEGMKTSSRFDTSCYIVAEGTWSDRSKAHTSKAMHGHSYQDQLLDSPSRVTATLRKHYSSIIPAAPSGLPISQLIFSFKVRSDNVFYNTTVYLSFLSRLWEGNEREGGVRSRKNSPRRGNSGRGRSSGRGAGPR